MRLPRLLAVSLLVVPVAVGGTLALSGDPGSPPGAVAAVPATAGATVAPARHRSTAKTTKADEAKPKAQPSAGPGAPSRPAATARATPRTRATGTTGTEQDPTELRRRLTEAGMQPGGTPESTAAAVRRFQAKFGLPVTGTAGPRTWAKLRERPAKGGGLDPRCAVPGKVICIDKSLRLVRAVEDGAVLSSYDARFGRVGMRTREGSFRVQSKSRSHMSSIYRTRMPFALFFSGGQAVHYSPDFARNGYSGASHGCVNLRSVAGAQRLFDWAPVGTAVVVLGGRGR